MAFGGIGRHQYVEVSRAPVVCANKFFSPGSSMLLPDVTRILAEAIVLTIDRLFLPGAGRIAQKYGFSALGLQVEKSIDERLTKIDAARSSLEEALSAIDALKIAAEENKVDLQRLERSVEKAELQKADLSAELAALRQLAAIDGGAVRKALKLPTRVDAWRERIIGLSFGIVGGVIASYGWELWIKPHIPTWLGG